MRCLNVTPAAASAELTIAASRISEKGRTFDCGSDLTFSEIHRRVAWGMVGLLAGIGISSCNHQSFTQGGRYLSIPSCAIDLRISECNSFLRLLSSEMACLSSLRDGLRSIPASVAHLSLYVGINASDADL